jgi:hypothetical protein
MATIRYRRNTISSLSRDGVSIPPADTVEFSHFFHHFDGLHEMSRPFTHEEIDTVVAHMPSDKSPGPDGFSVLFLKVCWLVVKYDFYRLC